MISKPMLESSVELLIFIHFMVQQESRRAYGTAVRGLVIHLNKIHLTLTLKVLNPNPNPKCFTQP